MKIAQNQNEETEFMEKYDPTPPINRSIVRSYFLKSYGDGFIIFAISYIFFCLFNSKDNSYIIVSFILYPFAKVLPD
ncbi:hypothetical protein GCM10028868_23200 [Virgibacillus kimchii]